MNLYHCILWSCLCVLGGELACATRPPAARDSAQLKRAGANDPHSNTASPAPADSRDTRYEILSQGCTKNNSCLVTVYLAPEYFNEEEMKEVANRLSLQFKDKAVVHADLFDDRELAAAHAQNKVELQERQHDRRGWYARYDDQEVLLFVPDKKAPNKFVRINLRANP